MDLRENFDWALEHASCTCNGKLLEIEMPIVVCFKCDKRYELVGRKPGWLRRGMWIIFDIQDKENVPKTIREFVRIRCSHCAKLHDIQDINCPHCGASC